MAAQSHTTHDVHLFINGRTEDRVSEAVRRIADEVANAKVEGMAADLGTAEGASRLIAEVSEVDILVNNVGIFEPKPFEEIPNADWLRFFEVNVMSGLRLSRHHLPLMKQKSLRTTEKSQLSSATIRIGWMSLSIRSISGCQKNGFLMGKRICSKSHCRQDILSRKTRIGIQKVL